MVNEFILGQCFILSQGTISANNPVPRSLHSTHKKHTNSLSGEEGVSGVACRDNVYLLNAAVSSSFIGYICFFLCRPAPASGRSALDHVRALAAFVYTTTPLAPTPKTPGSAQSYLSLLPAAPFIPSVQNSISSFRPSSTFHGHPSLSWQALCGYSYRPTLLSFVLRPSF